MANTVDIYFKGHNSGLSRAIAEVVAQLKQLKDHRINVKVDVDTASLARLRAQLNAMRNETVRVRVSTEDARGVRQSARDLAARRSVQTRVEITNLAQTEAQLQRLTRDRTVNIRTRVNVSEIDRLTRALRDLADLGDGARRTGQGVASVGLGAASALPKLLALTPLVSVLASGATGAGIYGLAGAFGAVTAGAGALAVGATAAIGALPIAAAASSQQVKDHFSFMANDVVTTMKSIAEPLQQPLVDVATAVGAAFHQMRPQLEEITRGTGDLIRQFTGKLPEIAGQLGPALQKAFQAGIPHMQNLINNLPALVQGFGDFMGKLGDPAIVQGAQRVFAALPDLMRGTGDAIVGVAEKFNSLMSFIDSGALSGFTSGISDLFANLGATDFSAVTSGLTDMANAFGEFVGGIDTANLSTNLAGLTTSLADFTRLSGQAVSGFQSLDEAFRGLNADSGGGPIEWGAKLHDSLMSAFDSAGIIEWSPEVAVTPTFTPPSAPGAGALEGLNSLLGGEPLVAPVTPEIQPLAPGAVPPIPLLGTLNEVTPPAGGIEVPLQAGPISPPTVPPAAIEVPLEPAEITLPAQANVPPLKIPVTYDVTALQSLTIQPPAPVKIPVEIDTAGANVDLSSQGAAAGQSFAAGLAGSAGAVAGAAATMAAAAQGVSVDLSGQGAAAGASFAAGLASQAGAVAAAAANLGAVAAANKGQYKGRKGIAADRIMLIPHGKAMAGGFIRGLGSQRRELIGASRGLARDVVSSFDDELVPNIGLKGGIDVSQKVYVQVEAGLMSDPVKVGREITNHLGAYKSAIGQGGGRISV